MKTKYFIPLSLVINLAIPAFSQQANDLVKNIGSRLAKGETTISNVLADSSFLYLHSLTSFRRVIEQNAKPGALKLCTDNEPGTRITVKGIVTNKAGNPQADKLVYVYQTSSQGWYADTAPHILQNEGDRRHARLFGYFKTGAKGEFEFNTVKPKGYLDSDLPAHIHIEIYIAEDRSFISELLFDDDPRLVGEIRSRSVKEQFLIVRNSGTESNPLYFYSIQVPN